MTIIQLILVKSLRICPIVEQNWSLCSARILLSVCYNTGQNNNKKNCTTTTLECNIYTVADNVE